MKKIYNLILPVVLIMLITVGCSQKKTVTTKKENYQTVNLKQLPNADLKKVIFEINVKNEKDGLQSDFKITNNSKRIIKFNLGKFYLADVNSKITSSKDLKIKPNKTMNFKNIFLVKDKTVGVSDLDLRYGDFPILGLIVRGFEEAKQDSNKEENKENAPQKEAQVNSDDEVTQVDTQSLNSVTWTPGVPVNLIGNYISDPSGQSTSMEQNYKIKLELTNNEFKLIPEAQMDGFFLGQIEHVKIDDHTYVLHGIMLGSSFYEKINVKKNGDVTINESHGEEGFGESTLTYHKL